MFDFSGNVTVPDWGINIGWGGYPPYYGGYPNFPPATGGVYYPPRDNSQIIMIGLVVLAVVLLSK